jgi:hypothetical protein
VHRKASSVVNLSWQFRSIEVSRRSITARS